MFTFIPVEVTRGMVSFLEWGGIGGSFVSSLSGMVVSSKDAAGGRWEMSCRMDRLVAGWYTGMYFLRFLSVFLPDPSTLTRYW